MDLWQIDIDQEGAQGFPKWRDMPPYLLIFFLKTPPLKLKPTPMTPSPNLRMKPPSPLKKKKSETVINTCVSLIK